MKMIGVCHPSVEKNPVFLFLSRWVQCWLEIKVYTAKLRNKIQVIWDTHPSSGRGNWYKTWSESGKFMQLNKKIISILTDEIGMIKKASLPKITM